MNHFILKLTSGENVYGVLDEENIEKKMVVLHNPLVWEEYESPDGGTGTALVKFIGGAGETSIPIASHSITSMTTMSPTFSKFYDAAVMVQTITDEAYEERLIHMTKRMTELVRDYQEKVFVSSLGKDALVVFPMDTEDTIH